MWRVRVVSTGHSASLPNRSHKEIWLIGASFPVEGA